MISAMLALLLQTSPSPGIYQPALPEPPAAQPPRRTPPERPLGDRSARFEACIDQAIDDPASAIVTASEWHIGGGGWLARQCQGFAHMMAGDYAIAAAAFQAAADAASAQKAPESPRLWAQAGNAWLAANNAEAAFAAFDKALVLDELASTGPTAARDRGLIYLDRGRTLVALDRPADAARDFAEAQRLVPEDALVWLLSATLARRTGDYARAQADLDIAARLAPRDPAIALEAGNIAIRLGEVDAARKSWQSAVDLGPESDPGRVARAYLARLEAELAPLATPPAAPSPSPPPTRPEAEAAPQK